MLAGLSKQASMNGKNAVDSKSTSFPAKIATSKAAELNVPVWILIDWVVAAKCV